ncbi:MAG: Calx-beta domain-containing protein [Chloroflexota bacterium]
MANSGRSLIITFLVIVAILLLALIGLLSYNIWVLGQQDLIQDSATLYLVDSSIRMDEPLGDGDTTRLEAAQRFVSQSAIRLPETEIISVHVFGSGASQVGCEDTFTLVPLSAGNQTAVVNRVGGLQAASPDAALVKAALEAIEELVDTQPEFSGLVQLIIVTGGDGTCNDDLEQIIRTANFYGLDLEIIFVPVNSNREAGEGITIPSILGAQEIAIVDEAGIDIVIDLINSEATPASLITDQSTAEPTEEIGTPTPPILEVAEFTDTPTPTSEPTDTPAPTSTPIPPTATDVPENTPTIPALNQTVTPVETPDGTPTATLLPSPTSTATDTAVPTPIPTNTPTQAPNQPAPTATSVPATPLPTNTPSSAVPTPVEPTQEPASSRIAVSDVIVNESVGTAFVVLTRRDVNSRSVLINYDTLNGTALAGQDYVAASGQVTWTGGEGGEKSVVVQILDDQVLESSESFSFVLSNPVNAEFDDNTAVITIQDNESGDILINPTLISVSESAGTTSAAITLNGQPNGSVSVNLSSSNPDLCRPASPITLDSSNWSSGVPIVVTIVDDFDTNTAGLASCTIQTSASTSSDPNFNGVNPVDITVQVIDNDAIYVDQSCPDADGNSICDDGIRFRTIQSAIDNGFSTGALNIIVTTGPHTESGIRVNKNINLTSSGNLVLQAAGNANAATDRIMTIEGSVTASLSNMVLQNGSVNSGDGGAILAEGALTLNNVTIQNNRAADSGGAIASSSTLNINNSQFANNSAGNCGGAIRIRQSSSAELEVVTFTSNQANSAGALCVDGLLNHRNGNYSGNIATSNAGAMLINTQGESEISNITLSNNRGAKGGAIYISGGSALKIGGATLSFNQSTTGSGGAIHTDGDLSVFNVTISGNQSGSGAAGVHNDGGIVNLFSATIAFNTSLGGSPSGTFGTMTLINTLLDANTGGDCSGSLDIFYSLIGSVPNSCIVDENGTVNQLGVSAGLASLTNNGGDTETHLPANPGPAIDTGSPDGGCLGFDQRGVNRSDRGAGCDIGAVER